MSRRILASRAECSAASQSLPGTGRIFPRTAELWSVPQSFRAAHGIFPKDTEFPVGHRILSRAAESWHGAKKISALRVIFRRLLEASTRRFKVLWPVQEFRESSEESAWRSKILRAVRRFCEASLNSLNRPKAPGRVGVFSEPPGRSARRSGLRRRVPRLLERVKFSERRSTALRGAERSGEALKGSGGRSGLLRPVPLFYGFARDYGLTSQISVCESSYTIRNPSGCLAIHRRSGFSQRERTRTT